MNKNKKLHNSLNSNKLIWSNENKILNITYYKNNKGKN